MVLEMLIAVCALVAGESPAAPPMIVEPAVAVGGTCRCPTPRDVQGQIAALESRRGPPPSDGKARPERHDAVLSCAADGTIDVVLRRASGERIADRALAAHGSCSDLATAVAVIIGSWEADLDPHVSPSIAIPAPAAPTPPLVVSLADREQPRLVTPARPPHALRFSVGVGLLAALTGGQVTPGATVQGDVLPSDGHLGFAGTITATTSRDSPVGSLGNVAQWSRVTLGLGPDARFSLTSTRIDLQAHAVAAVLTVGGNGLRAPSSASSLQLGGAAALRAAWAWGTSAVWVGTQVLVFPGDDRLVVMGFDVQGHLPHIELQLASGLSLGRFP